VSRVARESADSESEDEARERGRESMHVCMELWMVDRLSATSCTTTQSIGHDGGEKKKEK